MKKTFDVLVAGAGSSGICAAIAAARNGMQVLLLDQNGYPGGTNTACMVGPLMAFHDGQTQVVKGIAQEIVDRLTIRGGSLGHIPDPLGVVSTITPIDTELLKQVYFEMLLEESNITLLLYSRICDVQSKDGCLHSVTVLNKSGFAAYSAKVFIDATGDADMAVLAGAGYALGREQDGFCQPMSLMFSVCNVDLAQTTEYVRQNPDQFVLDPKCDLDRYLAVSGFFSLVEKAKQNDDFPLPRDRVLFFQGVHEGEVTVNMTRVPKFSGVDACDLTSVELQSHAQVDAAMVFLKKYIPGFANARLKNIASSTGVRESRRILGTKTLTAEMVLANRQQEDSVAVCAFPIDIHDPAGVSLSCAQQSEGSYDIPYGVMLIPDFSNLLVTGRCISATHEALASARITPTAMALGQAAGTAASLAVQSSCGVQDVPIDLLQSSLYAQSAIPGKRWL